MLSAIHIIPHNSNNFNFRYFYNHSYFILLFITEFQQEMLLFNTMEFFRHLQLQLYSCSQRNRPEDSHMSDRNILVTIIK